MDLMTLWKTKDRKSNNNTPQYTTFNFMLYAPELLNWAALA